MFLLTNTKYMFQKVFIHKIQNDICVYLRLEFSNSNIFTSNCLTFIPILTKSPTKYSTEHLNAHFRICHKIGTRYSHNL